MKKNTVSIEVSLNTLLLTTAFIVGGFLLWKIRAVIFMLFLAFIINSALRPTIDILEKKRIPRFVSVTGIFLILIVVVAFVMSTIIAQTIDQFSNFINELPNFLTNLGTILSSVVEKLVGFFNRIPGDDVVNEESVKQQIVEFFSNTNTNDITGVVGDGFTGALSIINSAIYITFGTFTVLIVAFYMLIRKDNIYAGALTLFSKERQKKYTSLLKQIEEKLGQWLRGQLTLMLAVGFLTWLGLIIPSFFFDGYNLNEFALLLGVLAAFLSAIPNLGPILTGFFGVIIAAGSNPLSPLLPALYIIILFTIIQQIEGVLLVPNVMRKAVGLDPVVTIIAVIAALLVFNIIGALIVIPFIAVVEIIIRYQFEENKKKKSHKLKKA
ncbi:AI-2E family transporter [Candidatus Dojkabacteria bacterium]|uniref:AI-2E family transporter n=1 Tax=Candidatus Dojkabacteria bacterium TaxID=2099670 RepID=A0A955L5G7_9BACT|nr:AI-2E family transporter [Candidatus Dojkabacteria bacterium]